MFNQISKVYNIRFQRKRGLNIWVCGKDSTPFSGLDSVWKSSQPEMCRFLQEFRNWLILFFQNTIYSHCKPRYALAVINSICQLLLLNPKHKDVPFYFKCICNALSYKNAYILYCWVNAKGQGCLKVWWHFQSKSSSLSIYSASGTWLTLFTVKLVKYFFVFVKVSVQSFCLVMYSTKNVMKGNMSSIIMQKYKYALVIKIF